MNKDLFKQALKDKKMNVQDFANASGNTIATMYRKINGTTPMTINDIKVARELFGLKKTNSIFFE